MQHDSRPFRALHAPVAPFTWGVQANLDSDAAETPRIPVDFKRPVLIVGFHPTVVVRGPLSGGGVKVPTTDDVLCLLDVNQQTRYTNRADDTTAAGEGMSFITLSSLGVLEGARLTEILLDEPSPDVGVQFRWKTNAEPGGGAQEYDNAVVALDFFCIYPDGHR